MPFLFSNDYETYIHAEEEIDKLLGQKLGRI